jgi:signal transduction histidine kinase
LDSTATLRPGSTFARSANTQNGRGARKLATRRSCRTLASDAMREVRTICSILHPPLMDEAGLTAGLRSYVRLFAERSGVAVNFAISDNFQRLPKEMELTLFCVAQESLANVHRHCKARSVEISVDCSATHVSVTVRDDGIGMAAPLHSDRSGSLLGIGIAQDARACQRIARRAPYPQFSRERHDHSCDSAVD